jgi:hypothetical protein
MLYGDWAGRIEFKMATVAAVTMRQGSVYLPGSAGQYSAESAGPPGLIRFILFSQFNAVQWIHSIDAS